MRAPPGDHNGTLSAAAVGGGGDAGGGERYLLIHGRLRARALCCCVHEDVWGFSNESEVADCRN